MEKLIVCIFTLAAVAALMVSCTKPQNDPNAQIKQGDIYYKNQDYKKAMEWYLKAAEQNHVDAQFNIGGLYYSGQGVPRDYQKAMKWYLKAAEQNDADAQVNRRLVL